MYGLDLMDLILRLVTGSDSCENRIRLFEMRINRVSLDDDH